MLQKLEHLSATKYHQLRKSKKTTIIKAIRNLESNALPVQQQQHLGIEQQQQQLHTAGRQQNDTQIQDVDDISMEDGTTLEDRIESTVRRILPEVVQAVISAQHRHDSSSPSMDCGSTTGTNRSTNTVMEQTRPTCGPIETRQHASECIIQSQGIPAQGPVNYQGAQQTDFESLSAGTSAGEHSVSGVSGRSNLVNAGSRSSTCFNTNSRNDRINYTFGLNSGLGTGFRGSVINPHLNRENNHNLSNDCRLGANSTQATSGSWEWFHTITGSEPR